MRSAEAVETEFEGHGITDLARQLLADGRATREQPDVAFTRDYARARRALEGAARGLVARTGEAAASIISDAIAAALSDSMEPPDPERIRSFIDAAEWGSDSAVRRGETLGVAVVDRDRVAGHLIALRRSELGATVEEIGKQAGVAPESVRDFEAGHFAEYVDGGGLEMRGELARVAAYLDIIPAMSSVHEVLIDRVLVEIRPSTAEQGWNFFPRIADPADGLDRAIEEAISAADLLLGDGTSEVEASAVRVFFGGYPLPFSPPTAVHRDLEEAGVAGESLGLAVALSLIRALADGQDEHAQRSGDWVMATGFCRADLRISGVKHTQRKKDAAEAVGVPIIFSKNGTQPKGPLPSGSMAVSDLHEAVAVAVPYLLEEARPSAAQAASDRRVYLERSLQLYAQWLERYTPMAGVAEFLDQADEYAFATTGASIAQDFETYLRETTFSSKRTTREVEDDVVAVLGPGALAEGARVAILGEPGAGKTTALWRLAADYSSSALDDPAAAIPVFVPLGGYQDDIPLEAHILTSVEPLDGLDALRGRLFADRLVLLLDGLNEIPAALATRQLTRIREFFRAHPLSIVLLTCREADYPNLELGLDRVIIKPLDPLRIRKFMLSYIDDEGAADDGFWQLAGPSARRHWTQFELLGVSDEEFWLSSQRPSSLTWHHPWEAWVAARDDPRSMLGLARNPYYLFLIARVYARAGLLPANRGELFHTFVRFLIRQELQKVIEEDPSLDVETVMRSFARLAFRLQLDPSHGTFLSQSDALVYLAEASGGVAEELLFEVGQGANLISAHGDTIAFTHQLLLEYFAANHLDEVRRSRADAAELWPSAGWWGVTQWDEAAVLLAGLYSEDAADVVSWIGRANPELAARCIAESGAQVQRSAIDRLVRDWRRRFQGDVDVLERAALGRALGQLRADDRHGLGLSEDGTPEFDWSELLVWDSSDIRFSKYLVTNAQFEAFEAADDGYCNAANWTQSGLAWRGERVSVPRRSPYPLSLANHPRTSVSWYEAGAFCGWLTRRLGQTVRLSLENEWLAAATTREEWPYSYGPDPSPLEANCREAGVGATTAVGLFKNDRSLLGLFDICGNAREWCSSEDDQAADSTIGPAGASWRPVRGGSFADDAWYLSRIDQQHLRSAGDAAPNLGFRVALVVDKAT